MSQWTHVIGAIQCAWDQQTATEKLGKPVVWDAKKMDRCTDAEFEDYCTNVWDKAFEDSKAGRGIPMGSEGSIEWHFVTTLNDDDKDSTIGAGTLIAIEGDLRDYGSNKEVQRIVDWFSKAVKKNCFAILTIYVETAKKYVTVISNWGKITVYRSKNPWLH